MILSKPHSICLSIAVLFFTAVVHPSAAQTINHSDVAGSIYACSGSAAADPFHQQFYVSASGLTAALSVTAPSSFEISRSKTTGYQSSISLTPASGSIASTIIYVRSKATTNTGAISGNIQLTSAGAVTKNVAVSAIITAGPVMNAVSDQTVVAGQSATAVTFSATNGTTIFNWTNNSPSIGLPASGKGNVPSFTTANTGTVPVNATITVTPVSTSLAYVPAGSNKISVVNTVTKELVTSVTVGNDPYGVSVSPDGSKVFVANRGSNTLSVISSATHQVTGTIPVEESPSAVVVSADGSKAYVVNTFSGSVSVVDVSTQSLIVNIPVTASLPDAMALNADGTRLYVIGGNEMSVINTSSNTEISTVSPGSVLTSLKAVAVSPLTGRIYVVDGGFGMNAVYVINPSTHAVVSTINPGQNPSGIVISPDGKTAYVSTSDSHQVAFVDLATHAMSVVSVGSFPRSLAVSPDGLWLYAASDYDGAIYIVNTSTRVTNGSISAPEAVQGNFVSGGIGCAGDQKTFTIKVNPAPAVVVSGVKGVIMACTGSPSASPQVQHFSISGSSILSDVSLTSPVNFELSKMPDTGYGSALTLTPNAGVIPETEIYVRSAAGVSAQVISGNVTISSLAMPTKLVGVKGVVNANPLADPVADQSFITGTSSQKVIFSGTANTFQWTNSHPEIGLVATGKGHIPSFLTKGAENSPVEATVNVRASSRSYAYVTHEGNTIMVTDLSTNEIVDTIALNFYPEATEVSLDKKWVYVTGGTSRDFAVINTQTNTIEKTFDIGGLGVDMVLSPDGQKLYIARRITDRVVVINTSTNTIERTMAPDGEPTAIEISADGTKLYVTYWARQGVDVIQAATGQRIKYISDLYGEAPFDLVLSPGNRLYICNQASNNITVVDTDTNSIVTHIAISKPSAVAIAPDGQTLYVASVGTNTVTAINTANNTVVKTIPVTDPTGLAVSDNGLYVYTANYRAHSFTVISTITHTVVSTIPMAYRPNADGGNFIVNGSGCEASDITFKITVKPVPPTVDVSNLSGDVEICYGAASGTSVPRVFSVSGIKLVSPVTIVAPGYLEVSTQPAGAYSNQLELSPTLDKLEPVAVYVRATSSAPAGTSTDNLSVTATGALTKSVSVTTIAHALPTLRATRDLSFVSGVQTTPVVFSGAGSTLDFTWSNNNASIGLPTSGRGRIPAFMPLNTGSAPVTATVTVAPKSVAMAFITNLRSDNVSVVNTDTKSLLTTVPAGDLPQDVAITPAGDKVYVVNYSSGDVSVISTTDYSVIGSIKVGQYPGAMLMNNAGTLVYVYNQQDGNTSLIDTQTNRVIKTLSGGANAMAISHDDRYLYIARGNNGQVVKLDAQTFQTVDFENIGESSSHGVAIAVSPDGKHLYATTAKEAVPYNSAYPTEDHVTVINAATLAVEASVPVWQINARYLRVSKDGAYVYVINIRQELVTISTVSNTVISTVRVPGTTDSFGIHNNQVYAVTSSYNSSDPTAPAGNLRIVDAGNGSALAKIYLGSGAGVLGNFISRATGCVGESQSFTITVHPAGHLLPAIETSNVTGTILTCDATASASPNVQQFILSGSQLTSAVTLSAPANFELSTAANTGFSSALSIDHTNGSIASTVVYVRSKANADAGLITGKVLVTAAGANTREVFVNGYVSPLADLQPGTVAEGTNNVAYSYTVPVPGNLSSLTISATGLPPGLSIDNAGRISGTPTQATAGPVDFTVSINNGTCSESATFSITINKATATVSVPTTSLTYNGLQRSVSPSTTPSGLGVTVTYNGSTDLPVQAGTYTVVATVNNSQYKGTGTGTLTIAKASLTARANNASRYYNQDNSPFTITYSGFVNSETAAVIDTRPVASTTATATSNVGTYSITLAGGSDNNYSLSSLQGGTLTVLQADQTVTLSSIGNKRVNDQPFAVTASSSAGLPIGFSIVSGPAQISGNTITLTGTPGTVVVKATQSGNSNYKSATAQRSFLVEAADQTLTFGNIADKYASDGPFTITASSSAGLSIVFSIVSGPAQISGNIISLTGQEGTVVVRATQSGTLTVNPAGAERSFVVKPAVAEQVLAPTGNATQTFCTEATVENLSANGTAIKWYGAATGGAPLASFTPLVHNTHYYASQTINGRESSARLDVTTPLITSNPPTGSTTQSFCAGATISNLVVNGTGIKWYGAITGGAALLSSTRLTNNAFYYASQTVNGCESPNRLRVKAAETCVADKTAPAVVSTTPVNRATQVDPGTPLVIGFNEPVVSMPGRIRVVYFMDGFALTQDIQLNASNTSIEDRTVTIRPASALPYGTTVSILIDAGVFKDISNNAFSGITTLNTWTFTTSAIPDVVAPTLASFVPAAGSTVASPTSLTMNFNEYVKVQGGSIAIHRLTDKTPVMNVSLDVSSVRVEKGKVTVTLPALLPDDEKFYVLISPDAITDEAGNRFEGIADLRWKFFTQQVVTGIEDKTDANDLQFIIEGDYIRITPQSQQINIHGVNDVLGRIVNFEYNGNEVIIRRCPDLLIIQGTEGNKPVAWKILVGSR